MPRIRRCDELCGACFTRCFELVSSAFVLFSVGKSRLRPS